MYLCFGVIAFIISFIQIVLATGTLLVGLEVEAVFLKIILFVFHALCLLFLWFNPEDFLYDLHDTNRRDVARMEREMLDANSHAEIEAVKIDFVKIKIKAALSDSFFYFGQLMAFIAMFLLFAGQVVSQLFLLGWWNDCTSRINPLICSSLCVFFIYFSARNLLSTFKLHKKLKEELFLVRLGGGLAEYV